MKEFTNDEGKLWVFDKQKHIVNPKPKSPKSIFFEWNRNATYLGSEKFDWLETLYSGLDDSMAIEFNKVAKLDQQVNSESEQIQLIFKIIHFANFIRWRVPARDEIVYKLYDRYEIGELSLQVVNNSTKEIVNNPEFNNFLKNQDVFRKAQASALVWEPWNDFEHIKSVTDNTVLLTGNTIPTLICDNPFIEEAMSQNVEKLPEFFFPISSNKIAYYLENRKETGLDSKASLLFELAKIESALKYVACRDREILEYFVDCYKTHWNKEKSFAKELFDYIK